ncbi:recombinase family protein [Coprococcus comes]|uniref:recombinase family protein n=1 Tax=Coprococcus comes TaxID=410072 RepID=UPI00189C6F3B|nr:recombinase family protein [Coprococcus comes]MDC0798410.1 recombinase family protein [Coprococcus comes]
MNRYGKRCVLYPRVSTEMQVDGYSLEGQKNMLTRFADREEMIVVDTYEDAGKSGKSIEGRPAFQKMLRDIEDGLDIDYILVYKLSRFGRNAADILNSLELVQSYGVNLICIEEGIDSSQTSGKLLISVLSAVAEIERENIIEQTMNGRREKARQGGWNGGFAPYGYTLEDNKLMIEETEAVAIRKIFELYTSSEIGLGGIANQLNLQGIRKIPRQNGTLEDWTGHFIKLILDNPVYCGKIAYGRRTKEKVKGTKNDYQMKRNDDYILTEGQHKGIVSEEVWEKAHAKRLRTGVKQPSKIGRDRVHLLSGLLKCPVCGSPMYTNKHAWTNKDGTSGISGSRLAAAHVRLGEKIGRHIAAVFPEKNTSILVLERGGRFFGDGVYMGAGGIFYSMNQKQDDAPVINTERVVIVDSVINTGKSIMRIIDELKNHNPGIDVIIAANVIQNEAVELFKDYLVFATRLSKNSFVGVNQSKQTGKTGPDTADRLFNLIKKRY